MWYERFIDMAPVSINKKLKTWFQGTFEASLFISPNCEKANIFSKNEKVLYLVAVYLLAHPV